MEWITTVEGDIDVEELGHCQPHEHVYLVETPAQLSHGELRISNLAASIEELKGYRREGGCSVVDAQPLATGRDARALADASKASGVHIIASTGFHLPFFYEPGHWIYSMDEDRLTRLFLQELDEGMFLGGCYGLPEYQTRIRAGIVKAIWTEDSMEGRAELLLRAAGTAAREAGTALMLHTDFGKGAVEALDLLSGTGLPPDRVLICHADRQTEDLGVHREIAEAGAYLEYDTITMLDIHDNESEIRLMQYMAEQGYLDQLLISTDPTLDRLKAYGSAVGMDYILTRFLPALREAGFTEEMIHTITRKNPAAALRRAGKGRREPG